MEKTYTKADIMQILDSIAAREKNNNDGYYRLNPLADLQQKRDSEIVLDVLSKIRSELDRAAFATTVIERPYWMDALTADATFDKELASEWMQQGRNVVSRGANAMLNALLA